MVNLIYSDLKESHISFADILRHSICANEVQLNTYCESCQRFSTAVESRRLDFCFSDQVHSTLLLLC